jgi:hypothetical protein
MDCNGRKTNKQTNKQQISGVIRLNSKTSGIHRRYKTDQLKDNLFGTPYCSGLLESPTGTFCGANPTIFFL